MNLRQNQLVMHSRNPLFYGWVVVAVGFLTLGVSFGLWYSFSVFFLSIIQEFGWTRAVASSIFSVFMLSQAAMGLVTGHLQDRFGPRLVIPFGAAILSISLFFTSRAQSLWQFYAAYGVVAATGVSLLGFSSHAVFIPKWFVRKRGLALGVTMSGIGFGMLLLIPSVEWSIDLFGWRNTYLYLGGLALLLVAPLGAVLLRRSPEDINLIPDGDRPDQKYQERPASVMVQVVDEVWAAEDWTLKKAISTRRFWFVLIAFLFGSWVYQATLLHAISAMVDSGLQRDAAATYFGILGIAGSVGKILFGHLSDMYGRERINTLAGGVTALGLVCLMGLSWMESVMPLLFAILFGLGYGAAAPLFPSVSADIFLGRSFGLIFSMIYIGAGLGGSTGPFITGYLRDISGSYAIPFALLFLNLFLSSLFVWFASPRKVRKMVKNVAQLH